MITEITGDLLDMKDGIICHQVNYLGAMGGGVAAQIRERLLDKETYQGYVEYCKEKQIDALGTVYYMNLPDGTIIANMFCQEDREVPSICGVQHITATRLDSMLLCLKSVIQVALVTGKPVYIPHHIGCGIAGGDWRLVNRLLHNTFDGIPAVEAHVVKREKKAGDPV